MVRAVGEPERGREAFAAGAWLDAHRDLAAADAAAGLDPEDLELLARAAYMLGRDDDDRDGLERAHDAYVRAGQARRAVRCAFWIGHNLLFRGEKARARGWFARAQRRLDRDGRDCVESEWLLIPVWESDSVQAIQDYVDSTLGASSVNTCYEVEADQAFAEQPIGLRTPAEVRA